MKWKRLRQSTRVHDVRGQGSFRRGGMPLRLGGGGGLVTVAILVIAYFVGGPDMLSSLLQGGGTYSSAPADSPSGSVPSDEAGQFVSSILGSTEEEWDALFAAAGERYQPPGLVMFSDAVQSACGFNSAAVGPFYCPPDRRVYLDVSFFNELARLGGPGDFAQAYVIGHEVGHHVQNLLGTADQVRAARGRVSETDANRLQVAMELQADCYAGVWAHHANAQYAVLEPGDVEEGLNAAAAIGDDTLQRNAGRRVAPESFTHGSAAQRQEWLRRGLESGDPQSCDTFAAL